MSYYDHAVMMALKLGPWAAPAPIDAKDCTMHRLEEPRPRVSSALAIRASSALQRLRSWKHRVDGTATRPVDGDARHKT